MHDPVFFFLSLSLFLFCRCLLVLRVYVARIAQQTLSSYKVNQHTVFVNYRVFMRKREMGRQQIDAGSRKPVLPCSSTSCSPSAWPLFCSSSAPSFTTRRPSPPSNETKNIYTHYNDNWWFLEHLLYLLDKNAVQLTLSVCGMNQQKVFCSLVGLKYIIW